MAIIHAQQASGKASVCNMRQTLSFWVTIIVTKYNYIETVTEWEET